MFPIYFGREPPEKKCSSTSDISYLVRMVEIVKWKAPFMDQPVKLIWMDFERILFADHKKWKLHSRLSCMPQSTLHKILRTHEHEKLQVRTVGMCNNTRLTWRDILWHIPGDGHMYASHKCVKWHSMCTGMSTDIRSIWRATFHVQWRKKRAVAAVPRKTASVPLPTLSRSFFSSSWSFGRTHSERCTTV